MSYMRKYIDILNENNVKLFEGRFRNEEEYNNWIETDVIPWAKSEFEDTGLGDPSMGDEQWDFEDWFEANKEKIIDRFIDMEEYYDSIPQRESIDVSEEQLDEARPTKILGLLGGMRKHPDVEDVIDIQSQADGMTALVRTTDGNAYEIQVRQAGYSQHPGIKRQTMPKSER